MVGVLAGPADGHLVRAPGAFDRLAVHLLRPRPPLWGPQDEHRPPRALRPALIARGPLKTGDLVERLVERGREITMNIGRLASGDEDRPPAAPLEERDQLRLGDAGEHGRVRDLVAVEMEDRQDRPIPPRVEELVRVPARRQGARLGLAVADDARDDEVGVVEGGPERVHERVAELAAFVDRARSLRRRVAWDPARERELPEELPKPVLAEADCRVELGVGALEVGVGDDPGPAVARAGDIDGVQVAGLDGPVQVCPDQVEAGRRAEMPEQPRLHVLGLRAARAGEGCRAGRSARPRGSSRRASTRR